MNQNQRRDSGLGEVVFIAICAAIGYWISRHWYSRTVRFLTGAGIGYLGGLVGIGAAFAGNTSSAAVWLTVILAAVPAVIFGEVLARFAGKAAEARHQDGVGH